MSIDRSGSSPEGTSSADGLVTYNHEHFWLKYFVADLWRTAQGAGLRPESPAPRLRPRVHRRRPLSAGRRPGGRPVLLHFGSDT